MLSQSFICKDDQPMDLNLRTMYQQKSRFILFWCLLAGFEILSTAPSCGQSVRLGWDPSKNPDILKYNIYRATHADSSFLLLGSVLHPDSTFVDSQMRRDVHYYYVATCFGKFGTESGFSNRIDTTIQTSTPVELSSIGDDGLTARLYQNYPNPFNAITEIAYDLPTNVDVRLIIYNELGREVIRLVDVFQTKGKYIVRWDARDVWGKEVGSGHFYCKIIAGSFSEFREMILVR